MDVSTRLKNLPVSATRKLMVHFKATKAKGIKIYHLNIGDPDVETPEVMLDVLRQWNENPIRYSGSTGEAEFIEAMEWYYGQCGYPFLKQEHIVGTVGGSEAMTMAFLAVGDMGDEILVFEPFYSNYNACTALVDINLVPVPTDIKKGFHLPERSVIEAAITPKTKAILITTPGNPTGTVYTHDEMVLLVDIAKQHDLFVISDEVYREHVFDGREHVSLFSFMQENPENTIVLDSLSKRYSLCGARLGTLVTLNEEVRKGAIKIAQSRLSNVKVSQMMGAKLKEVSHEYIENAQKEYEKRRDITYAALSAIPGVTTYKPEGAFYTMAALPVEDADAFSAWVLTDFESNGETVMFAPGSGFYVTPGAGKNEIRIAYVLEERALRRALEILKEALEAYANRKA